ncbi:1,4-alpha-glucan branching enzyme [Cytobacillus sp. Sa5YUA1]|uniref:1,4-alpha-glucan branching enzyme GlgB n=1 Tax=Cytobacillus stercorigallinarum TaxID=2762240 RepID=A0ABR8QIU2_9BACI|nr:1,4-alpha-glucan branching enzyme [Cytobacillus stercorigallinarum]MBD7935412.1 1,4-alpha-glucan branching enzyme [Cytobacillus stercorigallinarum]
MNTTAYPTEFEMHLFHEGNLFKAYELFGSHRHKEGDHWVTCFTIYAPHASSISLVGSFNHWNAEGFSLKKVNNEGIWRIQLEGDLTGEIYKYSIKNKDGQISLKADPFAFYSELRPRTASIVYTLEDYKWNDLQWQKEKQHRKAFTEPMIIYEMHLGTWKKRNGLLLTYNELAKEIIPYVKEHGFTHIELMPIIEHPYDRSWGYQGTGYYSATSRYGEPKDLMLFIDQCHQNNIGVILDWVPGHFCKDQHGLYCLDGEYVYEYETEGDRENFVWGTANFNLSKTEVHSFLISNAIFWMEKYHVDGFRIDAVSNIIFWPNNENRENPFGIQFLQKLNKAVFAYDPSILMMAEDSTDWPQVTAPVHYGGLGFSYKWNMGWMNDVLSYMEKPPQERQYHHNKMTFSLMYANSENFILPLSHDEVVHGKKSLLDKMPGDYWQKFAQYRLLLGFMMTHPGKKLLFMGFELGQFAEWKDEEELDWHLLQYEMHAKTNHYVKKLIKLYKRSKSLYEWDHKSEGFEWIDANNHQQSIFSFIRKGVEEQEILIVVCNFSPQVYMNYRIGVPKNGSYREVFNSDNNEFGGSHCINKRVLKTKNLSYHGKPYSIEMTIPPFGISVLRPVRKRKRSDVVND